MSYSRCVVPVVFFLLVAFACRKEAPPEPPYVRSIELEAVDASCTEAWLKVTLTPPAAGQADSVLIRRDSQTVLTLRLTPAPSGTLDSLLVDEGLLPNRTYTYKAYRLSAEATAQAELIDSSTQVTLTTLDSTSHSFSFQIDTLGVTSSVLYDVAIISESNIWAVGELYLNDSSGQLDPILYNLAMWNGTTWNIRRVPVPLCPSGTGYFPLRAIYAFSANDIWITGGGEMIHWDGQTFRGDCSVNPLLQGGLNKIWGSGSSIYAVGNSGTIVYSPDHGTTWRRVESGTNVPLTDVWGSTDGTILWISGYTEDVPPGTTLLQLKGGQVQTIRVKDQFTLWPDSLSGSLKAVWTDRARYVYVLSSWGMYDTPWNSEGNAKLHWTSGGLSYYGYALKMRGIALNDVIIVGYEGLLWHFNGVTVRRMEDVRNNRFILRGVAYALQRRQLSTDFFVAAGEIYDPIRYRGLVIFGRR